MADPTPPSEDADSRHEDAPGIALPPLDESLLVPERADVPWDEQVPWELQNPLQRMF